MIEKVEDLKEGSVVYRAESRWPTPDAVDEVTEVVEYKMLAPLTNHQRASNLATIRIERADGRGGGVRRLRLSELRKGYCLTAEEAVDAWVEKTSEELRQASAALVRRQKEFDAAYQWAAAWHRLCPFFIFRGPFLCSTPEFLCRGVTE